MIVNRFVRGSAAYFRYGSVLSFVKIVGFVDSSWRW